MKRVAGYARVSTVGQVKDGTSLQDQKNVIEEKCKQENLTLVKFYSDGGASGGSLDRPELKALISDAEKGFFDTIMFTKLDRLGRNIRDTLNLWHKLHEELKLEIICVKDPIVNTGGIMGKAMFSLIAVFAELERGMIKERTGDGRMLKWRKGQSVIGSLPLGYKKENGKVIINEEQRAIYDRIVSLYLDQHFSMRDIVLKLNAEGIPCHSGRSRKWFPSTIGNILKNEAYTGTTCQNQYAYESRQGKNGKQYFRASKNKKPESEWIEIAYPPLISKERFDQIQARIESQKRKPKKHHVGYESKFMAENVLFCGHCGAKIRKRHNPKENFHYFCYWWEASFKERETRSHDKCVLGYFNADQIDEVIFREITNILSDPGKFTKAWHKDDNIEELKERVENFKKQEKEL